MQSDNNSADIYINIPKRDFKKIRKMILDLEVDKSYLNDKINILDEELKIFKKKEKPKKKIYDEATYTDCHIYKATKYKGCETEYETIELKRVSDGEKSDKKSEYKSERVG